MPKIIRILRSCSMKIFSKFLTVNISKRHLCIAKNFIWTILKAIFSIFVFFMLPQIQDIQIVIFCPNILTNHTMESVLFSLPMMYKS